MITFLPLAITQVSEHHACLGAVSASGTWLRPSPILVSDVERYDSPYRYFWWAAANVSQSESINRQPEDCYFLDDPPCPRLIECVSSSRRQAFLEAHLDASVEEAFSGGRTLGLAKVLVEKVYRSESSSGRPLVKCEFMDSTGTCHDWMIAERKFKRMFGLNPSSPKRQKLYPRAVDVFRQMSVYFVLGLTKPKDGISGRFGGSIPLVVGIHTEPDYYAILGALND
jgi:hypothetical protein